MNAKLLNGLVLVSLMTLGLVACASAGRNVGDASTDPGGNVGDPRTGAGGNVGDANTDGPTETEGGSDPDAHRPSVDGGTDTDSGSNTAPPAVLEQYTPDQAKWDTFASKPFEGGTNSAHDPDGVDWISPAAWAAAEWDGTIYNPSQMTKKEFAAAICPSVDQVRGIREVFYRHKPFADNRNPKKAEIDEWHRIAINHVRALIGYTGETRQVKKDHCMFARARWGDERKFTSSWDAEYPGTLGSSDGPCLGSSNAHCGATFIPNLDDQTPYLPDGHAGCSAQQGAEGIFSGPKSNIPWSLKWSRGLCNTLITEGFWGGHVGPWFHREKFGLSFWDSDPSNNNNNAILRAKWTGELMPNLYCNPADTNCDPSNTGPNMTK